MQVNRTHAGFLLNRSAETITLWKRGRILPMPVKGRDGKTDLFDTDKLREWLIQNPTPPTSVADFDRRLADLESGRAKVGFQTHWLDE